MPLIPRKTELFRLVNEPRAFVRTYWVSLTILVVGAIADAITTFQNMRAYGPSIEAHPVQRWVSEVMGVTAGVPLAKLIQFGFVIFVAAWWKPWTPWLLVICGLLYSASAISNHFQLL